MEGVSNVEVQEDGRIHRLGGATDRIRLEECTPSADSVWKPVRIMRHAKGWQAASMTKERTCGDCQLSFRAELHLTAQKRIDGIASRDKKKKNRESRRKKHWREETSGFVFTLNRSKRCMTLNVVRGTLYERKKWAGKGIRHEGNKRGVNEPT